MYYILKRFAGTFRRAQTLNLGGVVHIPATVFMAELAADTSPPNP